LRQDVQQEAPQEFIDRQGLELLLDCGAPNRASEK
jgi:hypothetical protein